jgi:hypothetical protein
MKNITSHAFSPTLSERERLYSIVDGLEVEVRVNANPYGLRLDSLFEMAARINKKRGFLFVSKLLGKHIPVVPSLSLGSGAMLGCLYEERILGRSSKLAADILSDAFGNRDNADQLYRKAISNKIHLDEPTLFIGFAETATALGHSMFDVFTGQAEFLHTTRESITSRVSSINFDEEHSHAVAHRCYARDRNFFSKPSRIVLVDDEITTGKTALNIIRELHEQFGHRDFVVASLLDWRSEADRERFSELSRTLGVQIRSLALVEGAISVQGSPLEADGESEAVREDTSIVFQRHDVSGMFEHEPIETAEEHRESKERPAAYLKHSGRFGMNVSDEASLGKEIAKAAEYLSSRRTGQRVLCLGTGEFMYIPMRIAQLMGSGTYSQSTTRSPIHPMRKEGYAVSSAYRFDAPDGEGVPNFIYNVAPGQYDEAFVFVERQYDPKQGESFERALARIGIPVVHLVFFGK